MCPYLGALTVLDATAPRDLLSHQELFSRLGMYVTLARCRHIYARATDESGVQDSSSTQ